MTTKLPKLTNDVLRDATVLADTGQPGLAKDLLARYHGTTVLQRHLTDIIVLQEQLKETTGDLNIEKLEFLKSVKKRRKVIGGDDGNQ